MPLLNAAGLPATNNVVGKPPEAGENKKMVTFQLAQPGTPQAELHNLGTILNAVLQTANIQMEMIANLQRQVAALTTEPPADTCESV